MSPLVLVILIALAGWRIVRFWLKDGLVANQRIWVQNKLLGVKPGAVRTKLHYLSGCPWCLEFWVTGVVTAVVWHFHQMPAPGLIWLAAWGLCPLGRQFGEERDVTVEFGNTLKHREQKYE